MRWALFALVVSANPLSLIPYPGSLIPHPASRIQVPRFAIRDSGFGIRDERPAIRDSDVIDRILAVVSGQPITLSDATAAQQFRLVEPPAGAPDPLKFVVDRLVERTLILAEVERFQPPEPDPSEITVRVDELERRAGSAAALEKALAMTGLTPERLRRHIRDDLRITTYLNQRFGANTPPAERQAAIDAWVVELRRRGSVTVRTPAR